MIKVLKSVVVGPLEPYAAGFAAELERQGYVAGVACKQVGLAAHLSRWMAGAGAEPGDLTVQVAERYASARRAAGYSSYRSVHALEPLVGYLRGLGVAPAVWPGSGLRRRSCWSASSATWCLSGASARQPPRATRASRQATGSRRAGLGWRA